MPEIMLRSVVLPLPEGPTMYSISSKWASKLTFFTAHVAVAPSPKRLHRASALIAGASMSRPEDVERVDLQHPAHGEEAGDRGDHEDHSERQPKVAEGDDRR